MLIARGSGATRGRWVADTWRGRLVLAFQGNGMAKKRVQLAGQKPILTRLNEVEKARICRLVEQDKKPVLIAKLMKRSLSTIYDFLASSESTMAYGKMLAEREVARLVQRIVDEANVDQSLEFCDRMGVPGLTKRRTDAATITQNNMWVGMPNHPAMIAPPQEDIEMERVRLEELYKPVVEDEHGTPRS